VIKFNDLHPAELRDELHDALDDVMDAGWYILGSKVKAFEQAWADYCGARYCVAVGSGFDALQLALKAVGVGRGDEVIVPTNTCVPTWLAITATGAVPVGVEPDERTYTIDVGRIEDAITERTKAIVPVHLYGQAAALYSIASVFCGCGVKARIVEDACQAHGTKYHGYHVGVGIGCFSFYPTKNMGALGDAGAVVVHDKALADKLYLLRNYKCPGAINSRMDELQAAFLLAKLPLLDHWNTKRQYNAKRYTEGLADVPDLTLPVVAEWGSHCWHQYVVRHPRRDDLKRHLLANGIETMIHYWLPPHILLNTGQSFPIAERLAGEVLSLPIGPHLRECHIDRVIEGIRGFE